MNKNIGDYNSNILQLLHSNGGGHEYSLDDIASFVSENITGIFDRHYLRNRLFDLCRKGRIANPRMKIYSTPKQDPNLMLDIELMWDVFIDNAREYYLSGKHIPDVTEGKWRIERVVDVVRQGDEVTVRVREIDSRGRINLTLRGVAQNGGMSYPEPTPTPVAPLN